MDKQPGSEDDDHRTVDTLAAELGWAMREQAEQQSEYSLELEYMKRVTTSLTPVVYVCIDLLKCNTLCNGIAAAPRLLGACSTGLCCRLSHLMNPI